MLGIVINALIATTALLVVASLTHSLRRFGRAWQSLQAQMVECERPVQVRVTYVERQTPMGAGPRGGAQILRPCFGHDGTVKGEVTAHGAQRAAA
ncbi:hypothetical protein GTZ99_15850 [Novosphingobium sp. FSY-8]|uniref:Uncharacterized protein n=1 Tax=Novosphingobium ovatum TaxID=1908523 RepID=A0ABW9XHJ7_9SPHN|nr:hypothetical protein [Novosphingobium ovatum]NBC38028.1 hypothetical protein [Novosphingobium ovatum]